MSLVDAFVLVSFQMKGMKTLVKGKPRWIVLFFCAMQIGSQERSKNRQENLKEYLRARYFFMVLVRI